MPVALLFSFSLCLVTAMALWGGLRTQGWGQAIAGFDTSALAVGGIAVGAAIFFYGPLYGLALILSVALHEFGHVAAYRVAGHADARFRLIPLMGGVAISDTAPASQDKDFFISLMGPGICIAPMVLAMLLSEVLWDTAPLTAEALAIFAGVTGALNFFNLLPLWPLDGGRCVLLLAHRASPALARQVSFAMVGGTLAAAVAMQSMVLMVFALMGTASLRQADALAYVQTRMARNTAWIAAAAYLFTAAAHLAGGWWLLAGLL